MFGERAQSKGEGSTEDINLGFSPSMTREPSEIKPKPIWCDLEMCRGKFNRVLEAVFWSQTSNKVYCTYCWGLVAAHQPHGVIVSYGDEAVEEEKKESGGNGGAVLRDEDVGSLESAVQSSAKSSTYSPTKSMLATNNNPPNQHNDVILDTLCDMHNPAKQTAEFLRGEGNVKPRDTYREVEGVPKGATMLAIETRDR